MQKEHNSQSAENKIDPIPGYYSVIPQKILLDEGLTLTAIRLFGLLTSLARKTGYVFASNSYLAKQLDVHYNTVSKLLKLLEDKEYILRIFIEDEDICERKILVAQVGLTPPESKSVSPLSSKDDPPSNEQANPTLNEKTDHINNKEVSNRNDNNTSSKRPEVEEVKNYWEKIFDTKVNSEYDEKIRDLLKSFSVQEFKTAIYNRSKADYYKTQKPHYKKRPKCFFNYPKTIRSDLKRPIKKDILSIKFTYKQMLDLFHKNNLGGTNGTGYSTGEVFNKVSTEENLYMIKPEMKDLINL